MFFKLELETIFIDATLGFYPSGATKLNLVLDKDTEVSIDPTNLYKRYDYNTFISKLNLTQFEALKQIDYHEDNFVYKIDYKKVIIPEPSALFQAVLKKDPQVKKIFEQNAKISAMSSYRLLYKNEHLKPEIIMELGRVFNLDPELINTLNANYVMLRYLRGDEHYSRSAQARSLKRKALKIKEEGILEEQILNIQV